MACFFHLVATLHTVSVTIPEGLPSTSANIQIECFHSCVANKTCSAFYFTPATSSCYLQERWTQNVVISNPPTDSLYFVIYSDNCWFPGYEFTRSVGKCLKFSPYSTTWASAKQACESEGSRLVKLDNADHMVIIWNIIQSDYKHKLFWIGGNRVSGKWKWLDGSPVKNGSWIPGEPNSTGECIQITTSAGRWNGNYCSRQGNYICEKL